jgi:uncharacterized protein
MKRIASLLVLSLAALPGPGALAFDCTKAKTGVETAICADPVLKRLDDDLAAAYAAVRSSFAEAEQKVMTQSQKRWIARREACSSNDGDVASCVTARTQERLALLRGQAESGPGPGGQLVPQFVVQQGGPGSYDIDMALLRFATPQTPGQMKLNALADEIAAGAKLGPQAGEQSTGLAQEDSFAITYASPALMSVRHWYYVNEGGAHGNHGVSNFNIDMASGRLIAIGEVLAEPPAAILTLWCKTQIEAEKQKRNPGIDLAEGAAERDKAIAAQLRELSSWSIGETEIVVSFDPYAVGAYAEGSYECRFPTAGVREMALKGALLP